MYWDLMLYASRHVVLSWGHEQDVRQAEGDMPKPLLLHAYALTVFAQLCAFIGQLHMESVGVQRVGILAQIKERLEPSVPGTTIVNDGSIFIMMGFW